MANNTNNDFQDFDNFLADNPTFFEEIGFGDSALTTDADTESLNPTDLNQLPTLNNFSAPNATSTVPLPSLTMMPPPQQLQLPNMAMGPCYHPMVGWYYPTTQPLDVASPPAPMIPVVGTTPAASLPPSLPTSAPQPQRASTKRKYGPSAYLDARAAGRTSIGTHEADYFASSASRRDGRGEASKKDSFDDTFRRAKTRPSIVQTCVCTNHEADRIKRPKNAFILYRIAKAEEIRKKTGTDFNPDVSRSAGAMWKAEEEGVKQHYYALAAKEKQRHAEKHPDYVYRPGGPTRSKFGTKDCTCGAYELNVARALEKRRAPARSAEKGNLRGGKTDNDGSEDDEHKAPARSHPQAPAPTAVMVAPPANLDVASFGLPNNQGAEAAALYAGMKRKHDLTIATRRDSITAETPRKRRSPRSRAAQVNYHEPDEDENPFDPNADDLFDFGASCKTPASTAAEDFDGISPKNLRSSRQSSLRSIGNRNGSVQQQSPLFVTPYPPPTKSTRSKSRGSLREETSSPLTPIEGVPKKRVKLQAPIVVDDDEDDEDEDEDENEDEDDDNINVKMRSRTRVASKASSSASRSMTSQSGDARRITRRSGRR